MCIFYLHSSLSYKYEILLSIQEGIWAEIKRTKKLLNDSFGNPCGMMCWSMLKIVRHAREQMMPSSRKIVALFLYKMMCRYTCMYNNGQLVNAAFSINIGMGVQKLSYQTKEGSLLTKSVVSCIP